MGEERMVETGLRGIDRSLTNYADEGFSRYLRRAFLASAGYDKKVKIWKNENNQWVEVFCEE